MTRNQRLRPIQPIFDQQKMLGGVGIGNSPGGYALATGGIIITSGPTLVEHLFVSAASYTFALILSGSLDVGYVITPAATFNGFGVSGSATVTSTAAIVASTGTVIVSYDPSTDWTPT